MGDDYQIYDKFRRFSSPKLNCNIWTETLEEELRTYEFVSDLGSHCRNVPAYFSLPIFKSNNRTVSYLPPSELQTILTSAFHTKNIDLNEWELQLVNKSNPQNNIIFDTSKSKKNKPATYHLSIHTECLEIKPFVSTNPYREFMKPKFSNCCTSTQTKCEITSKSMLTSTQPQRSNKKCHFQDDMGKKSDLGLKTNYLELTESKNSKGKCLFKNLRRMYGGGGNKSKPSSECVQKTFNLNKFLIKSQMVDTSTFASNREETEDDEFNFREEVKEPKKILKRPPLRRMSSFFVLHSAVDTDTDSSANQKRSPNFPNHGDTIFETPKYALFLPKPNDKDKGVKTKAQLPQKPQKRTSLKNMKTQTTATNSIDNFLTYRCNSKPEIDNIINSNIKKLFSYRRTRTERIEVEETRSEEKKNTIDVSKKFIHKERPPKRPPKTIFRNRKAASVPKVKNVIPKKASSCIETQTNETRTVIFDSVEQKSLPCQGQSRFFEDRTRLRSKSSSHYSFIFESNANSLVNIFKDQEPDRCVKRSEAKTPPMIPEIDFVNCTEFIF